nr:glutamine--tRNA ligase/YqeY domain fusion protein [Kofleriaceae bacterium]
MASERTDFIRDIIDDDLSAKRHQRVATRFPPEPNGYLHIGHAKSICLNFGIARDYSGTCNLRYDDTNPAKEDVEYVESIERDVRWLGFEPSAVLFSADYFPRMYELAERLVSEGLAYACSLDDEQIRAYRGSLTEAGRPSPDRDRSPDANLALLREMRAGKHADGTYTLRAKIDMASSNMKMRDPLLYRIRHAHHHRTGDAWCIYPMYDWAHPLEDALEGITHSICTLEFENNRELYDWVIEETGVSRESGHARPHQYEFARLNLDYTVMSKRKLLALVKDRHVNGWDDPRMPTITAMRRRGYAPSALREFCDMVGVAKANSWIDFAKLEYCIRGELNQNAPRVMGVVDPLRVEIVNWEGGARELVAPYYPPDIGKPGERKITIEGVVYIDRADYLDSEAPPKDYKRLAPGKTVWLRHGAVVTAVGATTDANGAVTAVQVRLHEETLGGGNPAGGVKPSGAIHWVAEHASVPAELRIYDQLFKSAKPEEGGVDFVEQIDKDSLKIVHARVEASLAGAEIGSRWQFERVGYFCVDLDSKPGALVFNRIITLRDTREAAKPVVAAAAVVGDGEKVVNAKAKTRPKLKSGPEYRAEARVRDGVLADAYAAAKPLVGEEQADLLTGDRATAALFEAAIAHAEIAAKWIINELPRALGGAELEDKPVDGAHFAAFVELVASGKLNASAAKGVLATMVASGAAPVVPASDGGDGGGLADTIEKVIVDHADKVAQYKAGKVGLLGFLVGQVRKASPGADAAELNARVKQRLES